MSETPRDGAEVGAAPAPVRVVRAAEVATVRRASPDSAIVAVVGSTSAEEAIAARLAGADVVLPCSGDPDPADLAAATSAAVLLAGRTAITGHQTREAAHEFAGNASAVAMAAHLLAPDDAARAGQLRALAARGAELAWAAGRVGRSTGAAMEVVDLVAAVRAICLDERGAEPPELRVDAEACVGAIVDRAGLGRAVRQLVDNARRAGAGAVTVRVTDAEPPGFATVAVEDDGRGLPAEWPAGRAPAPFVSGWTPPSDGLGLAGVAEFVEDHGGTLDIGARDGAAGTRVVLRLPAAATPADTGGPAAAEPPDDALAQASGPDWALAAILEGIARRDPVGHSLDALVATMERYLPGSICSILLLDEQSNTLHHGAGARLPAQYREAIDGLPIGPLAGSCGTAAFTREEVVVADVTTDERWAAYYHLAIGHDLRSCWSRPILDVDRGVVLGTFAVYHAVPWVPDPQAGELVGRLTHVAAVAIGTAALHGRLVESEARFRSTFEAAGLGIALVSPDGTIQDANAALTAITGRWVVGESLPGLLDDDDAAAIRDALETAVGRRAPGDRIPATEVRVRRPDRPEDEPVWASMSGSLIRGQSGEPRHFCIELFDLTERRRVAQARRERVAAEAADRAKSELLALVSHEVRTPLNAVIGFAQVLQKMQLPPERQRAAIEHILGAGRHLLQLINDLLDLTGAEAGRLHLVEEPVAVTEVIGEAVQIIAGLAAERGITVRAPAADGPVVTADRQRLRQVLLNLLGNSIKFTGEGGTIQVLLAPGAILVCDTGNGIPVEQRPFLFTPFHRGMTPGTGSAEGSGLGLAVSKQLMLAMDGDLALVDTSADGTTFRLALPSRVDGGPAAEDPWESGPRRGPDISSLTRSGTRAPTR